MCKPAPCVDENERVYVGYIKDSVICVRFQIPGLGGAGVLVGSSGGLEKRLDGPAVALAAATAAQQAERRSAVSRDLALDLPPCPALPDGEERPYGASTRLRIRDYDQVNKHLADFPVFSNIRGSKFPPFTGLFYFEFEIPARFRRCRFSILLTFKFQSSRRSRGCQTGF